MIPRGRPDISYSEIFKGLRLCAVDSQSRSTCMHELGNGTLACLSVRTGFDLVLAALNFAPGTEILVTDINIPDMFSIISAHGLTAVPVSVNKESLHLSLDRIRAAMTPLTRAILITHLFGARMDTDEVVALAKEMKWVVIEDCAQAFTGNTFRGNPCPTWLCLVLD
ncbi:MAG: hypothetical protein JWM04_225 [Verrucomicrobiales bacterium]|nr:hypothetical protein [Verrucomicrobiales bacterium]